MIHLENHQLQKLEVRPDQMYKILGLDQKTDTHLKTAIYESNVCAGEVETSLNLSDGALHVGSCQSLGEAGEGQRHNKQLETQREI